MFRKIDSLESQKLTHLVTGLLKTKVLPHLPENSKHLLNLMKSHYTLENLLQIHVSKIRNIIPLEAPPSTSPITPPIRCTWNRLSPTQSLSSLQFFSHYKGGRKSKKYSKKIKRESRRLRPLPNDNVCKAL